MLRRRSPLAAVGLFIVVGLSACAHRRGPAPSAPSQQVQARASSLGVIAFEDDFLEGRLIFQALRPEARERQVLRAKLLHYLLDPLAALQPARLREEVRETESDDIYDRVFESFRDALTLYEPFEIWDASKAIPAAERDLLGRAGRLVVALFSPRGADREVALALGALATLEPGTRDWSDRLDQLVKWSDEASAMPEGASLRRQTSAVDVLENALGDWPASVVATALDSLYVERQKKFQSVLRRPLGGESARKALGDLLMAHGDEMQRALASVVTLYLRCGRTDLASQRADALSQQPGDDPELRAMLGAASKASAQPGDYLRLARRFLPRAEILGGTATDAPDLVVAARVLGIALTRTPADTELLILSAHVARMLAAPFLAIRQLEEARAVLERTTPPSDQLAKVAVELQELYFTRLQLRLDPERESPDAAEAETLRRQSAEDRQRFAGGEFRFTDADIDYEVGKSYVNAGMADRADALFARARERGTPSAGLIAEQAKLAIKRGQPRAAVRILRDGFDSLRAQAGAQEPSVGSVVGLARLQRLLGDAYDLSGERENAAVAWRSSLSGWEQLVFNHARRRNLTAAAESTVEVGRLLYLLGRRQEGIQKFDEAAEQDPDREQTYIDAVAFLVENGEVDAAASLYHRALSRPSRSVSEYMKVYTSMWVLDLTRRSGKVADAAAEGYLRALDRQHGEIRPRRGAQWYRQLARHAVGKLSFEQLQPAANTVGKKAEIYFYEAMRRLAEGHADDANQLLRKVIDTKMFGFFEFDMAARYLRLGAPTAPPSERNGNTETI